MCFFFFFFLTEGPSNVDDPVLENESNTCGSQMNVFYIYWYSSQIAHYYRFQFHLNSH